jgi:hypothetical protein
MRGSGPKGPSWDADAGFPRFQSLSSSKARTLSRDLSRLHDDLDDFDEYLEKKERMYNKQPLQLPWNSNGSEERETWNF